MVKPAARWTEKYKARTAVARPDYEWGIANPARPPTDAAIAQKATLKAKMADAATWDKWESGLRFVGNEGWAKAAKEKGAERYTRGVEFGLPKQADFASKFEPYLKSGVDAVHKMANISLEDKIARAGAMIRHNAKFRYKK
ncbi:MAG: hypothetical protein JRE40_04705 [Deltaproteobacteria bacterium]|nr:hypothetical protein [Deltaproteobacteria bacterium]